MNLADECAIARPPIAALPEVLARRVRSSAWTAALLTVVLFALVRAPSAASARSFVVPVDPAGDVFPSWLSDETFTGPVLAGDQVVWAQRLRGHAFAVRYADASGRVHRVGTVPFDRAATDVDTTLSGAPGRVGFAATSNIDYDAREGAIELASTAWTGREDGPLGAVASCAGAGASRCSASCGESVEYDVAVAANASALGDLRPSGNACVPIVRLSGTAPDGTTIQHTYDDADLLDLRDDYLLTQSSGQQAQVIDWRTGATAFTVPVTYNGVLLGDDGLVVGYRGNRAVYYTPAEPFAHPLPVPPGALIAAAGGGHFAYRQGGRLSVVALSGARRTASSPPLYGGVAVNADRVVWDTQPCAALELAVWDLNGPPPHIPTACTLARLRRGPVTVSVESAILTVPLRCPATARYGCLGTFDLLQRIRHRLRLVATGDYQLQQGTARAGHGTFDTATPPVERHGRFTALLRLHVRGHRATRTTRIVVKDFNA